ncbi:radical SAM protein [Desulfovibrio sp.]|uniref:radical SAM protein n=1 Tax=Desulfovibrio sp. TaxID=885 RepID=UPI0025C1AA72|nr:radical SAM protein [Desulfovibrio sp.]
MMLRRTQSLCPVCLRRVDAVYARSASDPRCVELRKTCPDHGDFSVPVWQLAPADASAVPGMDAMPDFEGWSRPKSPSYPLYPRMALDQGCPFDCGLCPAHAQHTCTGLVEVTMRCNMACPVCYAGAGNGGGALPADPDLNCLAAQMDALKTASGPCNVQISGGEPTVREDLPAIIGLARERAFGLVQVNTNGLRLAEEKGYAENLRQAGLDSVYLQWDGVSDAAFMRLRGRPCLDFKRRAVAACAAAGLGVVLVATLVRGVNDGEVGDLLRLALRLGPAVRGLHMQPAAFFGRYPWQLEEAPRLTLPEVMACLTEQAPELVRAGHFHPPGCENELCSFSAVYRRTDGGPAGAAQPDAVPSGVAEAAAPSLQWLAHDDQPCCSPQAPSVAEAATGAAPVPPAAHEGARKARKFVALHWRGGSAADAEAATAIPGNSENCCGKAGPALADQDGFSRFLSSAGAGQRFTLSAMAFQDALSLDIERVRGCCIHVLRRDGRMIPFCLHNLTARDGTRLYAEDAP